MDFFCNHHSCLSVRSKASDEAVLQDAPDVVGGIEDAGMDGHDEGDPLVVGGVRGIVHTLHALQLHDAHYVGLVLRGDVGGAMDPTVVLSQVGVDALELAAGKGVINLKGSSTKKISIT